MKLLLRDYLASLKEREELDAILPDLLSELGFTVISRPQRGTQQRGVDIAAVGPDDDGERKLFLFSVKAGDLTRQDWDGSPQALRSSLNEIRDVYLKNRVPARYKDLKVVICLAFGGGVQEQVRDQLKGYTEENTTDRVSFDEWNGDRIAGLLLTGILREELLPKPLRSSFQKAVAMVDEPDVSYEHFARLARALRDAGAASAKARVRAARQLNLCLWVLYVWSRDVGNLEAAYRAGELTVLTTWELLRPTIGKKSQDARALGRAIHQVIELHLTIASSLLEGRIFPHVGVKHGISFAVGSHDPTDVNLALFEILGRIGLAALWTIWLGGRGDEAQSKIALEGCASHVRAGLALIENNPALSLPITDRQATDVALFLLAWLQSGVEPQQPAAWLADMAARLDFAVRVRGRYPSVSTDYRDLVEHPGDRSDEYFEETTAGSTLIPLLAAWLHAFGATQTVESLARLVREKLPHSTLQLWTPDSQSEVILYVGDGQEGRALCELPVADGGEALLQAVRSGCAGDDGLMSLSAMQTGFWPVVLTACRHFRLPVPPGFWIEGFPAEPATAAAAPADEPAEPIPAPVR